MRIIKYSTVFFAIILFTGCSALIYAIRGPKYEGKFKVENYLSSLDGTYFYYHRDNAFNFNDSLRISGTDTTKVIRNYAKHYYEFIRFDKDGKIKVKTIRCDNPLNNIPTTSEIDSLPVVNEIYYVIKDSVIKYEIYTDSYNGFNLYKSRVYKDSIVDWQVGISKMYLKNYNRVKN